MMDTLIESSGYFLAGDWAALYLIGAAVIFLALGFLGAPLWLWSASILIGLWGWGAPPFCMAVFAGIALVFNLPPIRQILVTSLVFKIMKALNIIPHISETERVALNSGGVWVEREFFSGRPNLKRLMSETYPQLTAEEKAFIDGPVEKLCRMVDDWKAWREGDLPKEAWDYIKKERFFGMIIPKQYGGLGFSAMAHSEVVMKLASRSLPACITVMVPNSLGPAELLNHYGTEEQKKYYLPRLAIGEEIPCFALTEPAAGSDAAAMQASGVVFRGEDGKLYLRLNWNKRWITLAAVSTILGLAFKLKDPDNLLGKGIDPGITCALIPSNTPGVVLGRRHNPLGVPFYNCPTQGKDVVVPVDAIIGGPENAGQGWKMLMESLAAGRGISLPAQSSGGAKLAVRAVSAYSVVRKQFGLSIGKFEGIAEMIAKMTGLAYLLEGARRYTLGAIDKGEKPPVVTAIAKYNFTELARKIVNDAMDILGGSGISMGPKNLLAHGYIAMPIGITVEGANVLTRTLIIFGQGALRAHPYAYLEVDTLEKGDLRGFDRAFWSHIGLIVTNTFRSVLLSLSRGYLYVPPMGGPARKYYRKLAWASASFAIMTDIAMGTLGGALKTKEKVTGRFADILSWMYLATGALRRFEAEGRRKEDLPLLQWSMSYAFAQIQAGFDGLFSNMDVPLIGLIFRGPIRMWSRINAIGTLPDDKLELKIAAMIQEPSEQRDRITDGIYLPDAKAEPEHRLVELEKAFRLTLESEDVARKVRRAVKKKQLQKKPPAQLYQDAVKTGVITQQEFEKIDQAEKARWDAIQVDSFTLEEYKKL